MTDIEKRERIKKLRHKIHDIYMNRNAPPYATNRADVVPMLKEEILKLGGNPHVWTPAH